MLAVVAFVGFCCCLANVLFTFYIRVKVIELVYFSFKINSKRSILKLKRSLVHLGTKSHTFPTVRVRILETITSIILDLIRISKKLTRLSSSTQLTHNPSHNSQLQET